MPQKTDQERIAALEIEIELMDKRILSKDELAKVVHDTILEAIKNAGKGTKAFLVTSAVVIAALGIIGDGFKMLLGWVGFQYFNH